MLKGSRRAEEKRKGDMLIKEEERKREESRKKKCLVKDCGKAKIIMCIIQGNGKKKGTKR